MTATRLADRAASTFGLRILFAWGVERIVRMVAMLVWIAILANSILIQRPDLLYPAAFGSDTSNYVAFGERLASGGDLYALSPGDRPVPADNPPYWTVPILSPPQMAIPWAAVVPLPDLLRFYVVWSLGIIGTSALGFLLITRGPALAVILGSPLLAGLAGTVWSGNVNAIIAPAGLLVWWVGSRLTRRRWVVAASVIVALLAVVKIGPLLLWLWLVRRRGWHAAISGGLAALLATSLVLVAAGVSPFADYLATTLASTGDPTPLSIPGYLIGLGAPPDIARAAWVCVLGVLAIATGLSGRPRVGFIASIVGLVFLTPIVRQETISLILLAAAPWLLQSRGAGGVRSSLRLPVGVAAAIAGASVVSSLFNGGLARSSMAIANATDQPVAVRFSVPMQQASWGYIVGPGQSGLAWDSQVGAILEPVRIFRADCSLIEGLLPNGVASIRINDEGIATLDPVDADQPLAYSGQCALAMPPPGAGVD